MNDSAFLSRLIHLWLFGDCFFGFLRSNAAEDDVSGYSIAAVAVIAVPFANDFAGSKESRNYFAALMEYMSACIRSKPAQCSADSRHDVNGIQLAFV